MYQNITCQLNQLMTVKTFNVLTVNVYSIEFYLNPIQDQGGKQKGPPTSFSPVNSTNVGISPKNFLTFIFNVFPMLM